MIVDLNTWTGTLRIWKQERYVVFDNLMDGRRFYTNLHGSASDPIAVYRGGEVYMDITDYLRTYPTVSTLYFADDLDPTIIKSTNVQFVGLINPESVHIPYQPLEEGRALIVPPSKILLEHPTTSHVQCEFYSIVQNVWSITGRAALSVDERTIGQIDGDFTLEDGVIKKTFSPKMVQCGIDYALVRWVSFTGIARIHVLEARKFKTSVQGEFSLLPIDSEYIEIKGREDGFTLYLDGLSLYDLWYYSDIITSSKVEVSFDRLNYDRVQVTTNSYTLPDGENNDGKLEINVNWKRYDAVGM